MNKEEIKQVLQEIEKEKNVEAVEESSIDWQDLLSKAWKGKKFICDYFGFKEEETTIYDYEKVDKYKEMM